MLGTPAALANAWPFTTMFSFTSYLGRKKLSRCKKSIFHQAGVLFIGVTAANG